MVSTLYCDLETFPIVPCRAAPPIVCGSFAIDDGAPFVLHRRDPRFEALLQVAFTTNTRIVAHNAHGFEIPVFLANFPRFRKAIFAKLRRGEFSDTLVREKLLRIAEGDPREDFGLNSCLAYHNIPIQLDKGSYWRVRYGLLWDKPVDQWDPGAIDYSLGDTAVRDLWLAQARRGAEYYVNEAAQVEAGVALALSTCWGMRTDPVAAQRLYDQTLADVEKDKALLVREGLLRFVGDKPVKDVHAARARLADICTAKGWAIPRGDITEKMAAKGILEGNIRVDDEACYKSDDAVLIAYTNYGQAGTLLNKVKRLQHPVVQASYNVLVDTGRTSCRQGEDPKPGEPYTAHTIQAQNPARKEGMRECIVARDGHGVLSCDFDTHELRAWAQACIDRLGFSEMAKVLADPNRDVHVELGAAVFGLTIPEAYALKKTDKDKYKELRQVAKSLNFGGPGGLGAKTFVEFARAQYGLFKDTTDAAAEAEATRLIQIWKERWPEAQAYLDFIGDLFPRRGAYVSGTLVRSKRKRGRMTYCQRANFDFQGPAADSAKAGLVKFMYAAYDDETSPAYGCRLLAYLHDEILVEVPLDGLHEKSFAIRDLFVEGAQPFFPDVPITSSPAVGLCWSKRAGDPVFVEGRLVPYEWPAERNTRMLAALGAERKDIADWMRLAEAMVDRILVCTTQAAA